MGTRIAGAVIAMALLSLGFGRPSVGAEDAVVASYARVKQSLAIVASSQGIGTAFCIASSPDASYYVTNLHVVGSDTAVFVARQYPITQKMRGTVVARGTHHKNALPDDVDLAVIRVPNGNIPPLKLRSRPTKEGEQVAVAGYPAAQLDIAKDYGLVPSLHLGTVSALPAGGRMVEFDAAAWHGNSGGPVFDPASGEVVAVVDLGIMDGPGANLGISAGRVLVPFLNENGQAYHLSTSAPSSNAQAFGLSRATPATDVATPPTPSGIDDGPIPNVPGANHFVLVIPSMPNGIQQEIVAKAGSDLQAKLQSTLHVAVTIVTGSPQSLADAAQIARNNDAIATVSSGFSWNAQQGMWSATRFSVKESVSLIDRFGVAWSGAVKEKSGGSGQANFANAVVSSFADLNDQIASALYNAFVAPTDDPSVLANFTRYAFPIGNGAKKAFFGLRNDNGRVVVSFAPSFGSAAQAGIQVGDEVLSVNGRSTAGVSDAEIPSLYPSQGLPFDVKVRGADGRVNHLRFDPHDIRYYVNRRTSIAGL